MYQMKKWPEGDLYFMTQSILAGSMICSFIMCGENKPKKQTKKKNQKEPQQNMVLCRTDFPGILVCVQWKPHHFWG